MKYLLIGHYAGFDLDDPEDLVNNGFTVGTCDTIEEVILLTIRELNNFVNEQVENRFDLDDEDLDLEEVDNFTDSYEMTVVDELSLENIEINETTVVGHLYKDGEYYFEDLKIEVVYLG